MAMSKRVWTDEEDQYLIDVWGKETATSIMRVIGCGKNALYDRLHELELIKGDGRTTHGKKKRDIYNEPPIGEPIDAKAIQESDEAFIAAMQAAITAGAERVREGIVTEPCTSRALPFRFYPQVTALSRSVAADCVEATDGAAF